ncbi:DUF2690 domain-containing protein [Streptomyces sp. NPDC008092]|uniref:DUF2690 domain-containing protein n=1 Tax=Streptomyces sp. NPDC008092 TaxID=3364808 RepID=UPI0036F14779
MTGIPPECERLAARLRMLRDRRRLTLSELATESAYSRSSWQRWLAGRTVPPWPAVSVLCRLADEPEPGVRALWELAESAWSRRTATRALPPGDTPAREHAAHAARAERAAHAARAEHTEHAAHTASRDDPSARTTAPPAAAPPAPSAPAAAPPAAASVPPVRLFRGRLVGGVAVAVVALVACTVLLLTGAGRVTSGASAAATGGFHVGCTGVACDGKDPGPVLCGVEPKTLLHVQTRTGIGLEIRYNPLCRAAWARVWNAPADSTLTFTVPGRPTQRVTVAHADDTDPFVYTGLAAVTAHGPDMKACVTPGPGSPAACYAVPQP